MQNKLLIIGGAVLALGIVGTGGLWATENWLGQRLETGLETELATATGIDAAVGKTDVQLLQQKVVFEDLALANVPGFGTGNLLQIQKIELSEPSLQGEPVQVAIANLAGITVNIEGNLGDFLDPQALGTLSNINITQLLTQLEQQAQAQTPTDANGQPVVTFAVEQLTVQDIQVNVNLTVPWQEQAIARTLTVPNVTLVEVTNLNITEKLGESLGPALAEELFGFFLEEILPSAQEFLPSNLNLNVPDFPLAAPEAFQ
ncbi:MAG: hypothetical protein VKJ86_04060 [Synechococcus sp.]|nr:hypothetical protein [Synechococcus sp.]